jgi:hypothetical protein
MAHFFVGAHISSSTAGVERNLGVEAQEDRP